MSRRERVGPQREAPALVSVREAARRLGVHENTVRNWARRGLLATVRPGDGRYQKFALDEIDRVARELINRPPAVGRVRADELVDAEFLDAWSQSREAQELLPEVVGRLIAGTQGVRGLTVRSGAGVGLSGWDCLVGDSGGSPWVPAGPSAWEIGTGGDPERKADTEYAKRTRDPLGVDRPSTSFVFVTSRRWPQARNWERAQRTGTPWRGVRVIDADDLAHWLQSQPATNIWLSERVGLRPLEVRTASAWWGDFSSRTNPPLPQRLVLAGREGAAERLRSLLASSDGPKVIVVQGPSSEEAVAFIAAAMDSNTPVLSGLISLSREAWDRLSVATTPSILIPYVDDVDVGAASRSGHHVVIPSGAGVPPTQSETIVLGAVNRTKAMTILAEEMHLPPESADRLAGLAVRNLSTFMRHPDVATVPRRPPSWSRSGDARMLACLSLAGAWSPESEADTRVVARIANRAWSDVEDVLINLASDPEPPAKQDGGVWRVTAPDLTWNLLRGSIQISDVRRFCESALEVLNERDPRVTMSSEERLLAGSRGVRTECSEALRSGIAQGLALLGVFDTQLANGQATAAHAAAAVRQLLAVANADGEAMLWSSLSGELQFLAEAAPNVFLDAVQAGLTGQAPVLGRLFRDDVDSSVFSASSPHTGLLWALELVCWSPHHLPRAALALARLTDLDPGGRLANRPAASLRSVFLPWRPRTSASLETRLNVLESLRKTHPKVAWDLQRALMPSPHDVSTSTPTPRFRDWVHNDDAVSFAEWYAAVAEVTKRLIADAGSDLDRWVQLVSHIDDVPPEERSVLLDGLANVAQQSKGVGERDRLWTAMRNLIEQHRRAPNARWVLPDNVLVRLEELAEDLEPDDIVQRVARLFDWHPLLDESSDAGAASYEQRLFEARQHGLLEVLDFAGLSGIERLAECSRIPEEVGAHLAAAYGDVHRDRMVELLIDTGAPGRLAAGWTVHRANNGGAAWLEEIAQQIPQWPAETQLQLMLAIRPVTAPLLNLLAAVAPEVRQRYWREMTPFPVPASDVLEPVVDQLLQSRRPWAAVDVLAMEVYRAHEAGVAAEWLTATIIIALAAATRDEGSEVGRSAYEVGQLIDYLDRADVDAQVVIGYELAYFDALQHVREPRALFARLATDPDFFVELVCRVYKRRSSAPRQDMDEQKRADARNAWAILRAWKHPPGIQDDRTIAADELRTWSRRARLLLADADRGEVGDQHIGQVLAHSPSGNDGAWPCEEVRDLIDDIGSQHLDIGFVMGVHNARGVTVRGPYDGGKQEWDLVRTYRGWSASVGERWPRTGRVLSQIADDFEVFARREDAEAQLAASEP